MVIKARPEERLQGFTVFDNKTGEVSGDIYAMTEMGELLRKCSSGWMPVPKRGEYIVQYGGGCLEVW